MPPCKPFLTLDQLCSLAIDDRGLICADRALFAKYLLRTNYYRFSGYAREFQIDPKYGDNHFKRGITFEAIREIIDADSMMRFFNMSRTLSRGKIGPGPDDSAPGPFSISTRLRRPRRVFPTLVFAV